MSYILDSLRKAEQKRQTDEPLRMPLFFGSPPPARKKRPFWLYLLFVVLLFNGIAIFLFLISPWSGKSPDKEVVVAKNAVSSQESSKNSREALPKNNDIVNELPLSSVPKVTAKEHPATEHIPAEQATVTRIPGREKDAAEKSVAPPGNKLFSLNELPAAVKANLPAFKISGHAYSPNRHNRVTRVNEKILQEGEELSAGIKVEEIIPDGIIFNYQGYRFFVKINENR